MHVLGPSATLEHHDRVISCERRAAALLTYLALEGPTPRARVARLLWPAVPEKVARNNLVHTLGRLDHLTGVPLISREPRLALRSGVRVDLQDALNGAPLVPLSTATPLGSLEFDDAPAFSEWLLAVRERLTELREQQLQQAIDHAVGSDDLPAALVLLQQLLDLDPLSEHAHRTLMQVHMLDGDRPAALSAYRRYKDQLARELGATPHPDLVRMARDIDEGRVPGGPERTRIPMAVLRPPRLVGRDAAWHLMEEAWHAGKTIYLTGMPGVGKTRLALDFARSKGRVLYLQGRPGEQDVPFSGAVRNARARLAAAPQAHLPRWVKRELARVMPEFREGERQVPPMAEHDRMPFFQAHLEMVRLTSPGVVATITDDIQYYDQATMELGVFFLSHSAALGAHGDVPRHLILYRRDEITSAAQATVDRHVDAGSAVRIEVEPLSITAVTDLLSALAVPDAARLADVLTHSTGGNVQFVLETIKQMYETGNFDVHGGDQRLPGTIELVIQQRLRHLSPTAVQVVQAAAVLRTDITIERVAGMLNADLLTAASAWEELETAQVVAGERFSHDLVQESVAAGTPPSVRQILNRAAARMLTQQAAPAGVIAHHWAAGGDEAQAAAWFLKAAHAAEATLRFREAAALYHAAAQGYARSGDAPQASEALGHADAASRHAQEPADSQDG